MSRTHKDRKKNIKAIIKLGKKVKADAKTKKKTLKNEINPRALKLGSADQWDFN